MASYFDDGAGWALTLPPVASVPPEVLVPPEGTTGPLELAATMLIMFMTVMFVTFVTLVLLVVVPPLGAGAQS